MALGKIAIIAAVVGLAIGSSAADAQQVQTYYYNSSSTCGPGPVYGYGPARDVRPMYGYVAEPLRERESDNRALGTYVPRSNQNLSESRDFFR